MDSESDGRWEGIIALWWLGLVIGVNLLDWPKWLIVSVILAAVVPWLAYVLWAGRSERGVGRDPILRLSAGQWCLVFFVGPMVAQGLTELELVPGDAVPVVVIASILGAWLAIRRGPSDEGRSETTDDVPDAPS